MTINQYKRRVKLTYMNTRPPHGAAQRCAGEHATARTAKSIDLSRLTMSVS